MWGYYFLALFTHCTLGVYDFVRLSLFEFYMHRWFGSNCLLITLMIIFFTILSIDNESCYLLLHSCLKLVAASFRNLVSGMKKVFITFCNFSFELWRVLLFSLYINTIWIQRPYEANWMPFRMTKDILYESP